MRGIDYILSKEKVIIINILYLTYLFPTAGEMASNLRSRNYFWYEQISQSGTKFCDFSQFSNSLKSAKHQTLVTAGHSHPKLPRSYWDNVPACFYIFSVMSCILMAFKWSLLEISFPFFFLSLLLYSDQTVLTQNSSKSGRALSFYPVCSSIQTRLLSALVSQNANSYTAALKTEDFKILGLNYTFSHLWFT